MGITTKFAIVKVTDRVVAQRTLKFIIEDIFSSYGMPSEIHYGSRDTFCC